MGNYFCCGVFKRVNLAWFGRSQAGLINIMGKNAALLKGNMRETEKYHPKCIYSTVFILIMYILVMIAVKSHKL